MRGINAPPPAGSDGLEFDTYAWNLAEGGGYWGISPDVKGADGKLLDHPTAYRVPGTLLVWAALFKVFGNRYDAVRVFHCVVGAATILLVYAIGRYRFGEPVGLLAGAIYAVYPLALLYATDLVFERRIVGTSGPFAPWAGTRPA